MNRTELFKDITTGTIYTLQEMKEAYAVANDCDMSIDDYDMKSIIYENLACIGGNIEIIDDNFLQFLNDYAVFMEADRCMNQEEIDMSIKENYLGMTEYDEDIVLSIFDNIEEYNEELTNRFRKLMEE